MLAKTQDAVHAERQNVSFPYPEPQNADQRIANGFALLDHIVGEWWPVLIDLEEFDINQGSVCVLGQVFHPGLVGHFDDEGYGGYGNGYDNFLEAENLQENINGFVESVIYDEEMKGFNIALSETVGMDGYTVGNQRWVNAITAAQVKLAGSVEEATEIRTKVFAERDLKPAKRWV